jgi:hypothetical protein
MTTTRKPKTKSTPKPPSASERVRASEARKLDAGGKRMPGGVMPAEAVAALEKLQAEQYAPTASACIFRAVIDAAERIKPASDY